MDLDVITLKSFKPFMECGTTILGKEDEIAVCPAVITAPVGARFISRWIAGYDPRRSEWMGFRSKGRDKYWGELSTRYPLHLAKEYPGEVTILAPAAFYPIHWRHEDSDRLYIPPQKGGLTIGELSQSFTLHLWETDHRRPNWDEVADNNAGHNSTTLGNLLNSIVKEE